MMWPGFVDALSSLLLVIIFLLSLFMLSQFFLGQEISGKDTAMSRLNAQIAELTEWERDVVYPMAQKKIAIDLDDGVKRNYPLFAGALKPIKGLEVADD